MPLPYVDTPRTEVDGNSTHLTNGQRSSTRQNVSALSVENSFQAPDKDRNLLTELENARTKKQGRVSLRTPRPGADSRTTKNKNENKNGSAASASKGEFTPLMKSVTKGNVLRTADRRAKNGGTPAYPKGGENTPGLPNIDETGLYEHGSNDEDNEVTPVPDVASSSAQSTPLPVLPGRGNGVVEDGQNMMTLKEQENVPLLSPKVLSRHKLTCYGDVQVINKLEKENFGLKLRIHCMEDALTKRGSEYNRVALEENAELKVTTSTMKRNLSRYKKSLFQTERDLEACQQQLQELRQKSRSKQADDALQKELDRTREQLESKDSQVNDLEDELKAARSNDSDDVRKLREEVDSLEFTIREKDRLLDDRDEEIENLKDKAAEDSPVAELEEELEQAKAQLEDIQHNLEQARSESEEAKAASEEELAEKERAVEDLKELQDEMANKSFTTKGLSRQLEEKTSQLEEELSDLREQHATLQESFDDKESQERRLLEQVEDLQQELASERENMQGDVELARHERDVAKREHDGLLSRFHEADDEVRTKRDAKNLLQNRHDALTDESKGLQRELERARASIADLEHQLSAGTEHRLELDSLNGEVASLQRQIDDKEYQLTTDREKWESSRRSLELQKKQAEHEVTGYKQMVERLQTAESDLNGKESNLQQTLDGEKQRHSQEKELLNRQITELNEDVSSRRATSETQRHELLSVKEELRVSKRYADSLKEKVQCLEDEVVVLQASLEEQQEYARSQRKIGASDPENAVREKQTLRDQLANANIELNGMRSSISDVKAERDELQNQIRQFEDQVDDTHRIDQEKLSLRKAKLRLESETNRLKEEKKTLAETKESLQNDLDSETERSTAEENRLSTEISKLQDKLSLASGNRDRQLLSARNTIERLEARTKELDMLVEKQLSTDNDGTAASPDLSLLRQSLELARKKEQTLHKRETDLKATVKELKSHVTDLEKENHELQAKRIDSNSPKSAVSSKLEEEIRSLREQLLEAHKTMKNLRSKNNDLQRSLGDESERKDLHELLKSSTVEAESLSLKLSERDSRVSQLRGHLRRVREERALSAKKADAANRELEALQDRYEGALNNIGDRPERGGRYEKEIKGLGKEILWLRARLNREEKFRKGLAWSKGLLELGERVRRAWYVIIEYSKALVYVHIHANIL